MFFHFTFEKLQLLKTLPFVRKKGARYFHEDAFSEIFLITRAGRSSRMEIHKCLQNFKEK